MDNSIIGVPFLNYFDMHFRIFFVLPFFLFCACQQKIKNSLVSNPDVLSKINFDLSVFDENGLYGPTDGKRAMDYEFCIPSDEKYISLIQKTDPSVAIHKQSKGRINCSSLHYLCLGNTHQARFKEILIQLAGFDFVDRIDPCYFE